MDGGSEVLIRYMETADLGLVRDLRSVVGWSADPGAFYLLRGMRDARWAVAEAEEGRLVGMVGAVPLGAIGVLCHLAVHADYRGRGLGTRLTSWAVAYLRSRGAALIRLYSTPQAESVYRSAGFRTTAERTTYRLEEPVPSNCSEGGEYVIGPLSAPDLPEVCGVDLWAYGADRSALILATLESHSGRGLVARDSGGRIKGYLICSAAAPATRIGPFLAETPELARALMIHAFQDCVPPVEVTVAAPEEAAPHHLFEELGFTGRRDRLQMELGELPTLRDGLEHYGTTPYLAT